MTGRNPGAVVRLHRDPATTIINPVMADVRAGMDQIASDNGAESLSLHYIHPASLPRSLVAELLIAHLHSCDSDLPNGWLVQYSRPREKRSIVLATSGPRDPNVRRQVVLFGCSERVRAECVIQSDQADDAVRWFMSHGTPHPDLQWLDFLESVRNV